MSKFVVNFKKFEHFPKGVELFYATTHSAGLDLMAAIEDDIIINPLERILVPTGFAIEMPIGYEAQIRPRSGLALKNGITVLNTPGTIDNDYRGEIKIILINLGYEAFTITKSMRIAQMIFAPFVQAHLNMVDELNESVRADSGFGSTGN